MPLTKRRQPRPVRQVTPEYLERVAFWYMERYASSVASLRRVLMVRVRRSVTAHGTHPEEAKAWVEKVLEKCQKLGLLDDMRYAESQATSLHRRGTSRRAMAQKLRAKGLAPALIQDTLARLESDSAQDTELQAAMAYAKRRRLGPFRTDSRKQIDPSKDLASLARAGFSYDIARQVLHWTAEEE